MKKMVLASLAALCVAAPAAAEEFTGPRAGATIGFADDDFAGFEAFTYGVNVGYDFSIADRAVAGVTVEYQDSSEDGAGRDISAVARLGGKAGESTLVYLLAGYTNLGVDGTGVELDGIRGGLGLERALSGRVYGQVEYRYSNYELGAEGHQMVAGVGFRF